MRALAIAFAVLAMTSGCGQLSEAAREQVDRYGDCAMPKGVDLLGLVRDLFFADGSAPLSERVRTALARLASEYGAGAVECAANRFLASQSSQGMPSAFAGISAETRAEGWLSEQRGD